ncbi:MAG: cadmium-translocating P-type ATPase [Thermoplasmata archaeon]|nr:MAG: cadmium-translocating P-type ATPase [Thermoplasmata archaeon]
MRIRRAVLKGLDCASCAYKIEKALRREGFKRVSVNFASGGLLIDGDLNKTKEIIRKMEPNVEVIEFEGHDHEHHDGDFKGEIYRIAISLAIFLVGMALYYYYKIVGPLTIILFLLSYSLVGFKIIKRALMNALRGNVFDENFLVIVATLGAFAISEYPEAVGVMIFYVIGEFLQERAVDKSRRSIKSLLSLKAEYANLIREGDVIRVSPEELRVGDIILVRPGERIPVDGMIIEGSSSVDSSALTGESIPKNVKTGDTVYSGMINLTGLLKVRVEKELKDSMVSRILRLVEEASARKARTEKIITKFARYYTPSVIGLATLTAVVPPIVLSEPFHGWIYRALVLLMISCPCALVISVPLTYFAGIGRLAREGILVKGSNFIDALSRVSIVALDKTGTLTKGVFKVTEVSCRNGFTSDEVLRLAAIAERHSNHPIARAIKEAAGDIEVSDVSLGEYEEIPGHDVRAKLNGVEIIVGNDRILHKFNVEHDTCSVPGTVAHVAVNGKYAGYIVISDELKEDARDAVEGLRRLGIRRLTMVTGDSSDVASNIAHELGLSEFYAELLPEGKVRVVEDLERHKGKGESIAFVGDGVNDAPVIARADVGIAMGALGSDAAVETSDVVIMDDRPSKLVLGIKLAKKTQRIVLQNISLAISVKLAFILLGTLGEVTMWEAVFADVGVALMAILNSVRILYAK